MGVNRIEQKSVKKNILFYVKKSMVFDDVRQNEQFFLHYKMLILAKRRSS
jgi:hypothetical protein